MTHGTMYPPAKYRSDGRDIVARWEEGQPEREEQRRICNEHFDRHYAGRPKPWEVE